MERRIDGRPDPDTLVDSLSARLAMALHDMLVTDPASPHYDEVTVEAEIAVAEAQRVGLLPGNDEPAR